MFFLRGKIEIYPEKRYGPRVDEIISDSRGYCYHSDGLGSIVNLTDSTGAKANSYTYLAFGKMRNQSGTVSNSWLFTGRQYDSESSLYYYRNRYYDVKMGRFISRDPSLSLSPRIPYLLSAQLNSPLELHKYLYCGNNPVNFIDPYGLWYIDINVSAGWWGGVGTGGIMISSTGVYSYGGGGAGTPGPGLALTWSPSNPSTGWNFGAQGGFGLGGQTGIDTKKNKFWEVGFVSPSLSGTVYYVEPIRWPWQEDKNKSCKK